MQRARHPRQNGTARRRHPTIRGRVAIGKSWGECSAAARVSVSHCQGRAGGGFESAAVTYPVITESIEKRIRDFRRRGAQQTLMAHGAKVDLSRQAIGRCGDAPAAVDREAQGAYRQHDTIAAHAHIQGSGALDVDEPGAEMCSPSEAECPASLRGRGRRYVE